MKRIGFEITLAIILKLSLLFLLWYCFFSHSEKKPVPAISQHLFNYQERRL